jgi:folate-binding protein YgfZ
MSDAWRDIIEPASAASALTPPLAHADGLARLAAGATILAPLGHLGEIGCSGADSTAFLHNQLTSDINHLENGAAQYSAWCTAKGRMLASFLVQRDDDKFALICADSLVDALTKRLRMFILRSRVTISDHRPSLLLAGIAGSAAESCLVQAGLPVPATAMSTLPHATGSVLRLHDGRFLLRVERVAAAALWERLAMAATPVASSVWRWLDVRAGMPWITAATSEEFVPQMVGFDRLGGVSFHKGCYPGQEVIARTQYLGKVKRHLYRASGSSAIAPGAPLFGQEDSAVPCGVVVDAVAAADGGNALLAVVQESAAAGTVRVGSRDGEILMQLTPVAN